MEKKKISICKSTLLNNKKSFNWNNEQTIRLLESYKKYPELYAVQKGRAKNHIRYNAMKNIIKEIEDVVPGVDIEAVRKRIHNVRTRYLEEIKKVRKSHNKYVPRWYAYKYCSHLEPYIGMGRKRKIIEEIPEEELESEKPYEDIKYDSDSTEGELLIDTSAEESTEEINSPEPEPSTSETEEKISINKFLVSMDVMARMVTNVELREKAFASCLKLMTEFISKNEELE